ncbi:MAG: hypothetical protein N2249_08290 [Melioribacter sp.]|nr:hypothetical protein [Melioribacter sp.]
MKKFILIFLIFSRALTAQIFIVEKVHGDVQALMGMNETWIKVKSGNKLTPSDLLSTGVNSFVKLKGEKEQFILQSNSALEIKYLKKLTLNELLLALAMEEIRNVPKSQEKSSKKNTAVYGEKIESENLSKNYFNSLGLKKINGAKQLINSGYRESGILLAKETFRKYPDTKLRIDDRLLFVDAMIEIGLLNEATTELNDIKKICSNEQQIEKIEERLHRIKEKLAKK